MEISESGIAFVKAHEGCRLTAYSDPAGVMTIGYGHTGGVRRGEAITQTQAEAYLRRDLGAAQECVRAGVHAALSQNSFDALVSFAFNVGCGAFLRSVLLCKVNADPGDPSIRDEFMRWVHAGGKVLKGLAARRKDEADLYFGEP